MDHSSAVWRTSSYSGGNGGQCVEIAVITGSQGKSGALCAIRDSKDPAGPVLASGPGHGDGSPLQ